MPTLSRPDARRIQKAIREQDSYFFKSVLGTDPWAKQREIDWAVMHHRYVTVRSCNGAGKTWTTGRVGMRFLYSFQPSIVIATAPTFTQIEDAMFGEIATAHQQSKIPLGGTLNKTELRIGPKWYLKGRSTNQDTNFQGYHEENILFIVDEAPGVKESIFNAIDGNLTSANAHLLLIGNPTSITGRFFQSFKLPFFYKIHISAFDTPNFTLNGIKNMRDLVDIMSDPQRAKDVVVYRPELITVQWAYEKYLQWGEDSPMFQARVLGNFPEQGDKSIFPINWLDAACTAEREQFVLASLGVNPLRYYGVDPARYGTDASGIIGRLGNYVYMIEEHHKLDTTELGVLAAEYHETKPGRFTIDVDGLGSGVFDTMKHAGLTPGELIFESHSSGSAIDSVQFENLRAEMFWNLRGAFEKGEIYIPDHEELKYQLSSIEYFVNSRGRIQVQSKDEIKEKIGRSPDLADALALAYNGYMNTSNSAVQNLNLDIYKNKFNK